MEMSKGEEEEEEKGEEEERSFHKSLPSQSLQ